MLTSLQLPEAQSRVDPGVFCCALILAPIIPAAALFFLVVPVIAVPVGAIPYLLFGAPAYWLTLRRHSDPQTCIGPIVRAGLLANFGSIALLLLFTWADGALPGINDFAVVSGLGFVFAGLWSLVFAVIYQKFAKRHLPIVRSEIFE